MNIEPQHASDKNADVATKAARRRARRQRRARRAALKEVGAQDHDQVEVVDHWLAFETEMEEAIEELEGAEEQQNIDLPEDPIERAVMLGHEHALKPDQQAELNRRILMRSMHEL